MQKLVCEKRRYTDMPPQRRRVLETESGERLSEYVFLFAPLVAIIAMGILTIVMSSSS